MRLLFLNPIGALGGAERSLLDIFAALRVLEPAWEMRLILGEDGPLRTEAERLGVAVEIQPMSPEMLVLGESSKQKKTIRTRLRQAWRAVRASMSSARYTSNLHTRIEALNPDIIHSNGSRFHVLSRMLKLQGVPIVWHLRDFVGARRLMRRALRWAEPAATLAIANSNAVAEEARGMFKRLPIRTVLNCVDTERFAPGPPNGEWLDDAAGRTRANVGMLRVGLVASFARWKGQELFLKAASILFETWPDLNVRFYIVGGPVFKTQGSQFSLDELRRCADELNVSDRVAFVPFQSEPERVYRALDVVVHCSTEPEPFGRTIAEAMSCGRAVIATLSGGTAELFRPGIDALGAPPNDASELARLIEQLLRDPNERERLGANARQTALERFSRERLGREMRDIFVELKR
ncbi:MAG: glycosyltransferase family 4 protein [Planctomycetota bacterium]